MPIVVKRYEDLDDDKRPKYDLNQKADEMIDNLLEGTELVTLAGGILVAIVLSAFCLWLVGFFPF